MGASTYRPDMGVESLPPPSVKAGKELPPYYHQIVAEMQELNSLLVGENNENMDTGWHAFELSLLVDSIYQHFSGRDDFYAGGNNFVYFSPQQVRNRDFRGPDFFFVNGVPRDPIRKWWCVWQENWRYPDMIIELLSPTTELEDRGIKKETYERILKTPELFFYDPDTEKLEGWRLGGSARYTPISANDKGWMWSEQVGLWLGPMKGVFQSHEATWLRFFDTNGNTVLTGFELGQIARHAAEMERQRADAEKRNAEAERQRAEAEKRNAEAERQRAEAEKRSAEAERRRADALALEVAKLRALLDGKKD